MGLFHVANNLGYRQGSPHKLLKPSVLQKNIICGGTWYPSKHFYSYHLKIHYTLKQNHYSVVSHVHAVQQFVPFHLGLL